MKKNTIKTEILPFKNIGGNDLSAEFDCSCPSRLFINSPISDLMKTKVYLSGYNDNYFFDNVNKVERPFSCHCGKQYSQQWTRTHVILKRLN